MRKYWILFFLALAFTSYASIIYPKPIGADIWFHFQIAEAYLHGENGMFMQMVMSINKIPYPPLFAFMLLPSMVLNGQIVFARALQLMLLPVCLLFAMKLADSCGKDRRMSFLVGFLLLGSPAFRDAIFQIRPESLDMLLWLLLAFFMLKGKAKLGSVIAVLGVYNHSVPSLAFNMGIFWVKKQWKQFVIVLVASSPILLVSLYYLVPMLTRWVGSPASPQAYEFMHSWPLFTFTYLGSLAIAFPIMVYQLVEERAGLSVLGKFSLATVLSSLVMVFVWYDRYYQYMSIPFAFLVSEFTLSHKRLFWLIVIYATEFFILTYWSVWLNNFYGLWDIH